MRLSNLCEPTATKVLMSMDIYLSGYRKAQTLADDKIALEKMALQQQWKHRFNFAEHLFTQGNTILVTSPKQDIVFVSSNITALSGYLPNEVIGYTPRLFQGAKTAPETKESIRRCVANKIAFSESVINYRKDGSLYKCVIKGFPLFNRNKELVNFIAFEKEIAT